MRGRDLVEALSEICEVSRKEMVPMAGGGIRFEFHDIVVAEGCTEEDLRLHEDNIKDLYDTLDIAPDLKEFFNPMIVDSLMELLGK